MCLNVKITKQLPDYTIQVDFICRQDELLAMIGPSGAGKTTIIRVIAGLEKPDSGRITFNGETWVDTEKRINLPPRKRGLGYVFQDHTLFPHLDVAKNISFAAKKTEAVVKAVEIVGIGHLMARKTGQLSGGERQRVALAQALASVPQILLLDEPFSALDMVTRKKLRNDLKQLQQQLQLPILHVTHDLEEAAFLTEKVLSIEQGKVSSDWLDAPRQCSQGAGSWPLRCNNTKSYSAEKAVFPVLHAQESSLLPLLLPEWREQ